MKKYEHRKQHHGDSAGRAATHALFWLIALAALVLILNPVEVLARVGGGGSYGGGGGHGGGGGDGGAILVIIRLLLWLTIEYPAVGVPLDIIVIVFVVYRLVRRGTKASESFSSAASESSDEP